LERQELLTELLTGVLRIFGRFWSAQKHKSQKIIDFTGFCAGLFSLSVTRAGFKPTTACLEGRSSIQLSYRVGLLNNLPENRRPAGPCGGNRRENN
jgi:hypothetical protein